jgi:hypothetical protein
MHNLSRLNGGSPRLERQTIGDSDSRVKTCSSRGLSRILCPSQGQNQ